MIGFFEEVKDVKSMGRLLSFSSFVIATAIALTITWYAVTNPDPRSIVVDGGSMLSAIFLGAGMGGKVMQKFAEREVNVSKN